MLFYYVRHAQSINNALYNTTGSYEKRNEDAPLSDTGKKQLPYLAAFMQKELEQVQTDGQGGVRNVPVTLYCSLMERAVATASAIAERCQLPLHGYTDLHEVGGVYLINHTTGEHIGMPGKSKAFLEEHYPLLQYPQDAREDGWWNRPYESEEERPLRAGRVLESLLTRHNQPDEVVIFVSHGEFFNHLIKRILSMPDAFPVWFEMMNVAVALFDFKEDFVQIPFINRYHFLPTDLITG
ncbi:MAG: histidine phosphatase family protein [Anaerolineaceae bacterium]|jgi:2,3-bisphosphoglycerate-dependent phosphoglycerate mutase|nr:MAG: histidine phosphatase family protein [Anaerolineaceae bacterium]